jgi:hypothetical protein
MPMDRETHEAILNELLTPDLEQSRRTELLQQLRAQNGTDLTDFSTLTEERDKLRNDNSDLVVSNSKLFRQVGITGEPQKEKEKEKDFSETVSLEALERGIN